MEREEILVKLSFIEPYRLFDPDHSQATDRFSNFARLIRRKDGKEYKILITGTLFRSAVIRSAEILLTLLEGKIELEEGNIIKCCKGVFSGSASSFLRKRPTLSFSDQTCTADSPCPFCLLLGTGALEKRNVIDRRIVSFHNLELVKNNFFTATNIDEISQLRSINRIDPYSEKAFDYLKIREVDNESYWNFRGKVVIDKDFLKRYPISLYMGLLSLLKDSLILTNKLCGALCIIDIEETSHFNSYIIKNTDKPENKELIDEIEKAYCGIKEIIEKTKKIEKLRLIADLIKYLISKPPDFIRLLPEGKADQGHPIWDKISYSGIKIRDILLRSVQNSKVSENWQIFCLNLSNKLYKLYKAKTDSLTRSFRILGESEYYSNEKPAISSLELKVEEFYEWIIIGELKSETPFYFGLSESEDFGKFNIVIDRFTGKYRLPRSTLRGTIRNELREISDTYCEVKLGASVPCDCIVCSTMRGITVLDSKSEFSEPPQIRKRIRINPFTQSTDEGALFDMELGPEGITFPFIMRYVSTTPFFPKTIESLLLKWKKGEAFIGGGKSTGKGRFILMNLSIFRLDLKKGILDYIQNKGFREILKPMKLKEILENENFNYFIKKENIKSNNHESTYIKLDTELTITSPVLSNDPIAACFDPENHDAVFFKKKVLIDGEIQERYTLKGESIRGIFRTAFARANSNESLSLFELDHEECLCPLCQVFGNEHEASKIRFEDFEILNFNEKHIDHIAVDRFTSGTVESMKWDEKVLFGTKDSPLILKGKVWIRRDLIYDSDFLDRFAASLYDLRSGLYSIGAKGSIGYGQISDIKIVSDMHEINEIFNAKIKYKFNTTYEKAIKQTQDSKSYCQTINYDPKAIYNPYYFLAPLEKVHREHKAIGHQRFFDELYTGKLECTLEVLTPLIIGGQEISNSKLDEHKTYDFFKLDNLPVIPGSELRGMISHVYEVITNSCFRIFEEDRYITWRMDAKEAKKIKTGIVKYENGVWKLYPAKPYRLPLYDYENLKYDESWKKKVNKKLIEQSRYNKAINTNIKIGKIASSNRKYLSRLDRDILSLVLSGKRLVRFREECHHPIKKGNDCIDRIAILDDKGHKEGYIKFTSPNNLQISKSIGKNLKQYAPKWSIRDVGNLPLLEEIELRESNIQRYPRPILRFTLREYQYTITKRCERVFEIDKRKYFPISDKVVRRYNWILKDYEEYAKKLEPEIKEIFCTISALPNKELSDGDLVYYLTDEDGNIKYIFPVCISRKPAFEPLSEMLPYPSLIPCEREIFDEEIDRELISALPDKRLFMYHKDGLCPACSLFGVTGYRGRVKFTFAYPEENVTLTEPITLPLLEKPRPTWYIENEYGKVLGRKFYIHHAGWLRILEENKSDKIPKTKNNRTVVAAKEGSRFKFEVVFENLREWELGLLIYCLQLSEGNNNQKIAQKLGMAKPLGFGSVKVNVRRILLRQSPNEWKENTEKMQDFVSIGLEKLREWFKEEFDGHIERIKRLMVYQQDEKIRVFYPKLKRENDEEPPGYVELKDKEDGRKFLNNPWMPWYKEK